VKPYPAILSARFRVLLQYRAAALAGFGTQVFWGLMRVMIFTAFYRSTSAPQPMTLPETINYIWLGQALLLLVPFRLDQDVMQLIRTGNVAYEMLRPVDLYWLWYSRGVALRAAPTLLRSVPMLIVAGLFFGLQLPASWAAAAAFVASLLTALLLTTAIGTLSTIVLFWTISGEGFIRLIPLVTWFFSGIVIPLPLLPDWAQPILNVLPFRGIIDVPFRLYMGHIPAAQAPGLVAFQLAWTALIIATGRMLLSRGTRRLVVQGG